MAAERHCVIIVTIGHEFLHVHPVEEVEDDIAYNFAIARRSNRSGSLDW